MRALEVVVTHLSVNLNAVAQLRNRRNLPWPSVVGIARVVLDAGAAGITRALGFAVAVAEAEIAAMLAEAEAESDTTGS